MKIRCKNSDTGEHTWIDAQMAGSTACENSESQIYCSNCNITKEAIGKNLSLLEKLRTDLYSMYENKIDWDLFSEEQLLDLALNWKFFNRVHGPLLDKILGLNRLSKDSLLKILDVEELRRPAYATILKLNILSFEEIRKYAFWLMAEAGSDFHYQAWVAEFTLKTFQGQIDENSRTELGKGKTAAELNISNAAYGISGDNSGGRH